MEALELAGGVQYTELDLAVDHTYPFGVKVAADAAEYLAVEDGMTVTQQIRSLPIGDPKLLRDSPFLTDAQKDKLDQRGVIREGETVRRGDVLIGLCHPEAGPDKTQTWYRDASLKVSATWDGAKVTSVHHREVKGSERKSTGMSKEIKIDLEIKRPLKVGDTLWVKDCQLLVTEISYGELIGPSGSPVDVVVSTDVAEQLSLAGSNSFEVSRRDMLDVMQLARASGPRSLITMAPLIGKTRAPFRVRGEDLRWLMDRGLTALAAEFGGLRCDMIGHTSNEIDAAASEDEFRTLPARCDTACQSLLLQKFLLEGFGLQCDLVRHGDHVEMLIRPASDEQCVARSSGEIIKPETINYRTFKPEDDGLFCCKVFGEEGTIGRRHREAHIPLAEPVVSWLWRQGSPSVLEAMTGLNPDELDKVLFFHSCIYSDGERIELADMQRAQQLDEDDDWTCIGCGAAGIQKLIASRDPATFPGVFRQNPELVISQVLPIVPPDLRPLVLLDSGNFATSDLNDLYRRVLNRNNRLRKLKELDAPEVIIRNEIRMLQMSIDQLYANQQCIQPVLGSSDRPLKSLLDQLVYPHGWDEKRVQWVLVDRVIPDDSVPESEVIVNEQAFEILKLNSNDPVLVSFAGITPAFVAKCPTSGKDEVIRLNPGVFARLGSDPHEIHWCAVHRVLTDAARDEAKALMKNMVSVTDSSSTPPQWVDVESVTEAIPLLLDAIVNEKPSVLDSPRGLLLSGCCGVQLPDETAAGGDHDRELKQIK